VDNKKTAVHGLMRREEAKRSQTGRFELPRDEPTKLAAWHLNHSAMSATVSDVTQADGGSQL